MSRHRRELAEVSEATSISSSSTSPERAPYDDTDYFVMPRNDSQSSIGVPSLHDEPLSPSSADERERRLSPIRRLPPELLIAVFNKLASSVDLKSCLLVSKQWASNIAEILWHRPLCNNWQNLTNVLDAINNPGYFQYAPLVKRLNLSSLGAEVSDGTCQSFESCKRIERLTLTGCSQLTDLGVMFLVEGRTGLLALDITALELVTDAAISEVAEECPRLQGLNVTDCPRITDESVAQIGRNCKLLKRLKLNNCSLLTDQSITVIGKGCPAMLEIDLHNCNLITDDSILTLLQNSKQLRELRVAHCKLLTDHAFTHLPKRIVFDSLRILDLTACLQLHDDAVERIIDAAPRLRNLVLAKCKDITDRAVLAITKLGKNLHYIHLGHCAGITDEAVKELVKTCNRIRYIDLACCHRLTDNSVKQLATLPKLRRIGLVKCHNITDRSILALAKSCQASARSRGGLGHSLLERVHLSYCLHLTLDGIFQLLNQCPKLTHLSLTGVQAFYTREDLISFCREAPHEFTDHQRHVFCVFSGDGVNKLRDYLNSNRDLITNGTNIQGDFAGGGLPHNNAGPYDFLGAAAAAGLPVNHGPPPGNTYPVPPQWPHPQYAPAAAHGADGMGPGPTLQIAHHPPPPNSLADHGDQVVDMMNDVGIQDEDMDDVDDGGGLGDDL